jgi:hypothetical protein
MATLAEEGRRQAGKEERQAGWQEERPAGWQKKAAKRAGKKSRRRAGKKGAPNRRAIRCLCRHVDPETWKASRARVARQDLIE